MANNQQAPKSPTGHGYIPEGYGDESSFQVTSEYIKALIKEHGKFKRDIAQKDASLIPVLKAIEELEKTVAKKRSEYGDASRAKAAKKKEADEKNPRLDYLIKDIDDTVDNINNGMPVVEILQFFTGSYKDKLLDGHRSKRAQYSSQKIDVAPYEQALEKAQTAFEKYNADYKDKLHEESTIKNDALYKLVSELLIKEQAIRTSLLLDQCAQSSDTSLDEMLLHPPIQKFVEGFANGHLTRETLDLAIEWASIYRNQADMPSEELAFKQFINRRVIPNIGAFEAFASMVDDFQKTGIKGYPKLELLKQKEVSFSGTRQIASKEAETAEAHKLAETLTAMANKINTELTSSKPVLTKLDNAIQANEDHLKEFEKLFLNIEEKIDGIVEKVSSYTEEKSDRLKKLDHAIEKNEGIEIHIGLTEAEIKGRGKHFQKEKPRAIRMLNEGLSGAADGALRGGTIGGGDPHSAAGGGAFGFFRGLNRGWKKKIDPQKIEATVRQELLEYLRSQQVDIGAHQKEINEISDQITKLAQDKEFEEKVSDNLKIERIKNAYVTRMLLHSGKQNTYLLNQVCESCDAGSVDDFLSAFNGELGMSLKRFCYGIANTNDMTLILHEANTLSGDLAPHKQALKSLAEDIIKPDANEFLAAASKVDAIGQSNLLPYGSPFQLTQGIVRDEDDFRYKALMVNEFGMSKIGLQDVKRTFDFYLHRHGSTVFYDTHLNNGKTDNAFPKRIHVEPRESMVSFVDRTKQAMSRGADEIPQLSDIFMRICAYEYFLPQKIETTSNADNAFSINPAAPAAYPMINDTVNRFIEQMSLGPIQRYREVVGDATRLDNVIAQTFVDYFAHLGLKHKGNAKIKDTREELRYSVNSNKYGAMFGLYTRQISQDSVENFKLFMDIYRNNMEQELPTMTADDRALLEEHLAKLPDTSKAILRPEIIKPGSHQAGFVAKYEDNTFKNTIDGQLGRR